MSVSTRLLRRIAAGSAVAVVALGAGAACGDSNDNSSSSSSAKPDKLVVDTFGEFGYDDLVKQYEKDTGIKVELRKTAQLGDYRPRLVRYLATGESAAPLTLDLTPKGCTTGQKKKDRRLQISGSGSLISQLADCP